MASSQGLMYWNEKFGKTEPRETTLIYKITAAKTLAQLPVGGPALPACDGYASQAVIDAYLGTTNEFLVANLDSTAVGADSLAVLLNMGGQAAYLCGMTAQCFSGTGGSTLVQRSAYAGSLTTSVETACELGSQGNIALKIDFGNTPDFDGLTDGLIVIRVYWISK